jgi:hypothetical protein
MQELIGSPHLTGWLRVASFLLLMAPMNLLVGGSIIAAATATFTADATSRRLVAWLARSFPAAMGWSTIAGLLALYLLDDLASPPSSFPSASPPAAGDAPVQGWWLPRAGVAGGWPIVAIIAGLVVAGLLHGLVVRRGGAPRSRAGMWAITVSLAVVTALCAAGADTDEQVFLGTRTAFGPSLAPRLLHILLAAVAVSGMLVALHGLSQRRRDAAYGRRAAEIGMRWFAIPTAIQMVVGFYFLLAIPAAARSRLLGGSPVATAELVAGILLAIAALSVVTHATSAAEPGRPLIAGALLLAATLIVMSVLREQVRFAYVREAYARSPGRPPSWAEVAIPLALMAATGAGMTLWLLRRLRAAPPT